MTRLALSLAALATAAVISAPSAIAQSQAPTAGVVRLAQADVNVRVTTPATRRRVVKKKVVVRSTGRNCRTVTVRTRSAGRVVTRKVRRCS